MILYLFKLILILVFNIGINTYYINSECKCCCESNKNNSGGGKHVDKFAIDLDNNEFKCNEKKLTGFKKIDDPLNYNVKNVIHGNFMYGENIYYTIDEDIFNSIKKDSIVKITKNSYSDTYIVFAVKTQVEKFGEGNQKYDYYLVYCDNCNNKGGYGLFYDVDTNVEIKILGSGNNLTNIGYMFYGGENLKKITFNPTCFDTNKVTDMSYMFKGCKKLEELNLSTFDTRNVTDMSYMFKSCKLLTKLNVSNFDTSKVENMECMFKKCILLTKLNVSNFITSNVDNMDGMFYKCNSLTSLDVSSFNTEKVTDMEGMFYECNSLTSLNLFNFSTDNVGNMENMFAGCTNLTKLILPNKVIYDNVNKSYGDMFYGCEKLKKQNVTTNDKKVKGMLSTK